MADRADHAGRRRPGWVLPGVLLLLYVGGHYGDQAASVLTGWPEDWTFALLQAASMAGLWGLVWAAFRSVPDLARHPARRVMQGVALAGVADSGLRVGCGAWWLLDPVPVPTGANLCSVRTGGVDLYGWGLAAAVWMAAALAGVVLRSERSNGPVWPGGSDGSGGSSGGPHER